VTADAGWANALAGALSELGIEPREARRIAEDSLLEAAATGSSPGELFGPAYPYARKLSAAVRRPAIHEWPEPVARQQGSVLLRLVGVRKRYKRHDVLRPVDLTVRGGEVAAVVGANGSGKSTLLRICAGLTRATSGQVSRVGRVGYVPQAGGVIGLLTPAEHFELFGAASGVEGRRARSTGRHLAAQLSWRPSQHTRTEQLSGGTRQKLNLVLGQLHAPDLLLLDEPYQGFDQGSYLDFWQQVYRWREAGKAVVVVTHLLHELDHVDHVVDLGTGQVEQ
jgi:ABC-2 type transport system ATP-binding protein